MNHYIVVSLVRALIKAETDNLTILEMGLGHDYAHKKPTKFAQFDETRKTVYWEIVEAVAASRLDLQRLKTLESAALAEVAEWRVPKGHFFWKAVADKATELQRKDDNFLEDERQELLEELLVRFQ
jgi:hypothetical protein